MTICQLCSTTEDAPYCIHWYGGMSEFHDDLNGHLADFKTNTLDILADWVTLNGARESINNYLEWLPHTDYALRSSVESNPPPHDLDSASKWISEHVSPSTLFSEITDWIFYDYAQHSNGYYSEYNPVADDEDEDDEENEVEYDQIPGMSFGTKHIWVGSDHAELTSEIKVSLERIRKHLHGKWTETKPG